MLTRKACVCTNVWYLDDSHDEVLSDERVGGDETGLGSSGERQTRGCRGQMKRGKRRSIWCLVVLYILSIQRLLIGYNSD
jgi:hypothetical protein